MSLNRWLALAGLAAACREPLDQHGLRLEAAASGGAVQTSHAVANGDLGHVQWFTTDSDGTFTNHVLEVRTTGRDSAFLFYSVDAFNDAEDPPFHSLASGFGRIPLADLQGGGGSLSLDCDLTANVAFTVLTGERGRIKIHWRPVQGASASERGTTTLRRDDLVFRTTGYTESSTAAVSGDLVGLAIPRDAIAFTGRSHAVTIEVARATVP